MTNLLKATKEASAVLRELKPALKTELIREIAAQIDKDRKAILEANKKDIENATNQALSSALIDRLTLKNSTIDSMIASLNSIANQKDPVGRVLDGWVAENGLSFEKISIPIGVIALIYESRPNVTTEVVGLSLKSSNAIVLKGGKEAINSNTAIINSIKSAIKACNIDPNIVTFLDIDREQIKELLKMDRYIDVIIPRGSSSLVKFIAQNSTIPLLKHDEGICHLYIEKSACIDKSVEIAINAKAQRPAVCNAIETLLVDEEIATLFLPLFKREFDKFKGQIYADKEVQKIIEAKELKDNSFCSEYLDYKINIKLVKGVDEAIAHIKKYSSLHSEAICSNNHEAIEKFLNALDSACLYVNASTRFSDGYEFGFGGEIGISTNKLHARGPVGLNELTTYKYIVRGDWQSRQ